VALDVPGSHLRIRMDAALLKTVKKEEGQPLLCGGLCSRLILIVFRARLTPLLPPLGGISDKDHHRDMFQTQ
jgi:hypothetical protein